MFTVGARRATAPRSLLSRASRHAAEWTSSGENVAARAVSHWMVSEAVPQCSAYSPGWLGQQLGRVSLYKNETLHAHSFQRSLLLERHLVHRSSTSWLRSRLLGTCIGRLEAHLDSWYIQATYRRGMPPICSSQ
jgi:hypothetical protein